MTDPMLSPEEDARNQYTNKIVQAMRDTIEEDRANRRAQVRESPPVIIGAAGMLDGLTQAI